MLRAVDRKTGVEVNVTRTEDNKFMVELNDGVTTKKLAESTFKKYYKLTGETVEVAKEEVAAEVVTEEVETVEVTPVTDVATKKAPKKLKEVKILLMTFTGMVIGGDSNFYTALYDGKEYILETHKKGTQRFDKNGVQIGAKNPKFANRIKVM